MTSPSRYQLLQGRHRPSYLHHVGQNPEKGSYYHQDASLATHRQPAVPVRDEYV
jgi:hypothetical protein